MRKVKYHDFPSDYLEIKNRKSLRQLGLINEVATPQEPLSKEK